MSTEVEVYGQLRSRTATLLGLDPANLTPLKALKLDRVVLLQLELDRCQAQQAAGEPVDLGRMKAASEQLEELLPRDDAPALDLTYLSDEELSALETLIAKVMSTAPPIEPPDERQPDHRADLLTRMGTELDELRRNNTTLKVQLETARNRLAHFEAEKVAQPEDEAEVPPAGPQLVINNSSPHFR